MNAVKTKAETDNPLGPEHRCMDFDDDCKDVPDPAIPRTHLSCWLYDPARGWCPFLLGDGQHAGEK